MDNAPWFSHDWSRKALRNNQRMTGKSLGLILKMSPRALQRRVPLSLAPVILTVPFRRVPLRHSHPNMVHRIESSGAVVDMDMATPLMNQALSAVGCDFHPLLIAEEKSGSCETHFGVADVVVVSISASLGDGCALFAAVAAVGVAVGMLLAMLLLLCLHRASQWKALCCRTPFLLSYHPPSILIYGVYCLPRSCPPLHHSQQ